jgi:hypothetical protein
VMAVHPSGVAGVRIRADAGPWATLTADSGRWIGRASLSSSVVPPGGRDVAIDLHADNRDGSVYDATSRVRAVDASNPAILSFTPSDGAKLPGTAVGVTAEVRVAVQDAGQGALTSGIEAVEARVDAGNWVPAVRQSDGDPSTWLARVFVPAEDDHVISVRARDASGRTSAESPQLRHRVVVTVRTELRDLSRQTYLQDLLAFAGDNLWTRPPEGAAEPPAVTSAQIGEALRQDVAAVGRMGAAEGALRVRTLRLVAEALARYVQPGAPAPLAGWPLHEGQGTVVADTAGGRAAGTIENASWLAGEDPPVLHFEPADSAHVRVGADASAQVRVRDHVTLVARVRPSADTTDPGIIINKEGEYEIARYPDGTLQWALANTNPGWNWVNTGAVAPIGEWTHIAVAYDGERVRTWTNGVLRHEGPGSGTVGDIATVHNELWIGGRPLAPHFFAGEIDEVAIFDRALGEAEVHRLLGRSDDDDGARLWVDDDLPDGAEQDTDRDAWEWVTADPEPVGGTRCHRSQVATGEHQHLFRVSETAFPVGRGDVLVTDVWIDPLNPPREVMLQWRDEEGSWQHRAYWGEDLIDWGTDGTESRRHLGDLPAAGTWVTMRVPARLVGLENQMVHGVGYVLFDGRAAWDRTGRVTAMMVAGASGHLAAANAALLRANGTSEVELRLARGAPFSPPGTGTAPTSRVALAQRLGITLSSARPDELDELLLDLGELSADALAQLFGYPDPLGGAPAPPALPTLSRWRMAALRERWRQADRGVPAAAGLAPVVDPEVLVVQDIIDSTSDAAGLLRDRIAWRQTQVQALNDLRAAAADDTAAVTSAFGTVFVDVDLDALAATRRAGQDITSALLAAGLTQRELLRLLQLRDLANTGPLRDDEWQDLVAALARVLRRRNWLPWRNAEATADVVVDPAVFRDATGSSGVTLPQFIDATARQDWLDRLAVRTLEVESIAAAQAAAIATADDAALPLVRDALLATVDPGMRGLSVADALSSVLFVDVGAGAEDLTSRVDQAIEAVQGIIFAARTNRLAPQGPWPPADPASRWVLRETAAHPRADFDEEWRWMGAYAAWQAAVSVFFRPELMLYPALRPGGTPSFSQLLRDLAGVGSDLTPQLARDFADRYRRSALQDATTRAALDGVVVRERSMTSLILSDQLTPDALAALAQGEPQLLSGIGSLAEVRRELQEVLWLVPLQLAVALSRAGEHVGAIDWLRTLYAYDQASTDRIIFDGFNLEAGAPGPLQRPEDWLLPDELNPHRIAEGRPGAHLRFALLLLARCLVEQADAEFTADTMESRPRARAIYLAAARSLRAPEFDDAPGGPPVPANPLLQALRGRVAANLSKLRRGLTIAGVPRPAPASYEGDAQLVLPSADSGPLTPPARPAQPTPYRYATLVARAQQLLALAAQVESSYLSALAGAGEVGYTEQRANNDLIVVRARTAVGQAAVDAADEEVLVTQAQALRAARQAETLEGWIAGGESDWEQTLLDSYTQIAVLQSVGAASDAAIASLTAYAGAITPANYGMAAAVTAAAAARAVVSGLGAFAQARSQEAATRANYERRTQEWQLQASMARDDESIANLQSEVMRRRANVALQERNVAQLEEAHAQAAVTYLAGRRLTSEMYAWMAGQLGDVYRYLLRQATSVAQMAQQQLAFERQQPPPDIIKADYWTAAGDASAQGQDQPDRRGLTGSARLLRDLTQLDEHAFETNRRKLNLEHIFALSRVAPEAFADFRRTGVLDFATPMEAFDRRFPGHFLRTIRRVRLSMVALVPPYQGIAGTLTCSGQSRVVIGQSGVFRVITLTRPPETVAYTAPVAASGIFELDAQPELKYFFEDHGVDTTWRLELPKAANPIDYQAIAEVLVSIEYTALTDPDYARQVRSALPRRLQGTLALSIRDQFPDAWYALAEADPAAPTAVPPVSLPVTPAEFPHNVEDIRLQALALLVVRSGDREEGAPDLVVDHLHLVRGDRRLEGGPASATGDVISTRLGTGAGWLPLLDPPDQVASTGGSPAPWDPAPTGEWELALSSDVDTREALRSGAIADLALVLSYRADLPAWPA